MSNIKGFRHIAIVATDLEGMLLFYTTVLGLQVKRQFVIENEDFQKGIGVPNAKAHGAHLIIPNSSVEIELFQFSDTKVNLTPLSADQQGYRHFALVVNDLQKTYSDLKGRGIQFLSAPITVKEPQEVAGFQFVYLLDPEGNIIELNQLPQED